MRCCSTCLSSDRRLSPLKNLQSLGPLTDLLDLNLKAEDRVCWECEALLCRINNFRNQVQQAQEILKSCQRSQRKKKLKCLSKLSYCKNDSYDEVISVAIGRECDVDLEEYDFSAGYVEDWEGYGEEGAVETLEDEDDTPVYLVSDDDDIKNDISNDTETIDKPDKNEKFAEKGSDPTDKYPDLNSEDTKVDYKVVLPLKLSKDEEQFIVSNMSLEEMYKTRDLDRNATVYKRCPYKCQKCIIGYYHEDKYYRHLREKHESELHGKRRMHKCDICEVYFTRRDAMEAHWSRHFRRYTCRACAFSRHKLASMLAHRDSHGAVYTCDVCDKQFDRLSVFRTHKEKHKERPKCDICGKTASNKSNLRIHMMVHTGTARAHCPDCGRSVRAIALAAHRRTHTKIVDETAYCAECGRQYATRQLYMRHVAVKHGGEGQRFPCTECDASFSDKCTLARHVSATHLKLFPFKCNICNKGFVRKDRVQKHIQQRHEGIAPPRDKKCPYCDKGFDTNVSLRRHIRTHTGERPYPCPHCPAAFAQSSSRTSHVRARHDKDATAT